MAKQAGNFFIEGTFDDLTFYKMCGAYYVRMKTSLTGKRFWRDKAFEGSRKSCSRFGEGNKLASSVFKMVREEKRTNRLFPFLRTKAIALLKEGKESEEVIWLLVDYLVDFGFIEMEKCQKRGFSSLYFLALPQKVTKRSRQTRMLRRFGSMAIIFLFVSPFPPYVGIASQRHCSTPIIFSSA